jgi:phospholipid transport system transporter-binding protein
MKLDTARIDNDNVVGWLDRGLAAVRANDVAFDLSGVRECNTAAVAMLLAWQREAAARGARIAFDNVPANLSSLAKLYDVEELLFGAAR